MSGLGKKIKITEPLGDGFINLSLVASGMYCTYRTSGVSLLIEDVGILIQKKNETKTY